MEDSEEAQEQQLVHFTIEVLSVMGLPQPLTTAVELSGFAGEAQRSVDFTQASTEPGPWSFGGKESIEVCKELALENVAWRQKPRPRLLDVLAGEALIVKLLDVGNGYAEVGVAETTLEDFIFDESDKQFHLDLQLNDEYIGAEVTASAAPILTVRVQASDRIGLTWCPEDYEDWTVLSVKVDGVYSLPVKLVDPYDTLKASSPGKIEDHPFAYQFRIMNCKFNDGYVVKPEVEEEEEVAPPEGAEDAPDGEGAGDQEEEVDQKPPAPKKEEPQLKVDLPTFLEGLRNVGYTSADEDGPVAFKFMDDLSSGYVGMAGFCSLQALEAPASLETMVDIRSYIIKHYSTLRAAYDAWTEAGGVGVTSAKFKQAMLEIDYPDDPSGAFVAMDLDRDDMLSWSEFQNLAPVRCIDYD